VVSEETEQCGQDAACNQDLPDPFHSPLAILEWQVLFHLNTLVQDRDGPRLSIMDDVARY